MRLQNEWHGALRTYFGITTLAHSVWEILQLPLYSIWSTGTSREIMFAVVHCTAGDLMISALSLIAALVLFGRQSWPEERFFPVALATLFFGIGYTIYSEWSNTVVLKTWAYSELMPRLPVLGTGLSPLIQWLIVPILGFAAIRYLNGGADKKGEERRVEQFQ